MSDAYDNKKCHKDDVKVTETDGPFNILFSKNRHSHKQIKKEKKHGIEYTHSIHTPSSEGGSVPEEIPMDAYVLNTFPRGKLLLLNVRDFSNGMNKRNGTDKDAEDMCSLFLDLGFSVERHDNPSTKHIKSIVEKAAKEDYSELSCFACAILSHGDDCGIFYATDGEVDITDFTKMFRTSTGLVGKPKFFIFQFCRGNDMMDAVQLKTGRLERDGPVKVIEQKITLPTEADFLYAYSTVPMYYSWRCGLTGSWFIQALNKVFRKHSHKMEVNRMLTRVNDEVAKRESDTKDPSLRGKRQIPSIVSQLRKDFFLFPAYGPLPSPKKM